MHITLDYTKFCKYKESGCLEKASKFVKLTPRSYGVKCPLYGRVQSMCF
jgi:hypothetical protein